MPHYDFSSLTASVTRNDRKDYKKFLAINAAKPVSARTLLFQYLRGIGIIAAIFAFLVLPVTLFKLANNGPEAALSTFGIASIIVIGMALILIIAIALSFLSSKEARLYRFAKSNGLAYKSRIADPAEKGIIFSRGSHRATSDQLSGTNWEIGNYAYYITRYSNTFGYVRITLPKRYPHMILDDKKNNLSVFGVDIENSLGDITHNQAAVLPNSNFSDRYTLYTHKASTQDIEEVFSDAHLQLISEWPTGLDAEVIENNLYLYSNPKTFNLKDQKTVEFLLRVVDGFGE